MSALSDSTTSRACMSVVHGAVVGDGGRAWWHGVLGWTGWCGKDTGLWADSSIVQHEHHANHAAACCCTGWPRRVAWISSDDVWVRTGTSAAELHRQRWASSAVSIGTGDRCVSWLRGPMHEGLGPELLFHISRPMVLLLLLTSPFLTLSPTLFSQLTTLPSAGAQRMRSAPG